MNKVTLENPILINGEYINELTYDAKEITALQFSQACAKSAEIERTKAFTFKLRENDYALHMYLGFMAVIAVNPQIDIADMERIKGIDILKFTNIGMVFTLGKSEVASEENSSGELSENTADISEQA